MIVCLSFPYGLTSTRRDSIRYNPKHPLFIEKISKIRIEFPCVPHIAMSVDLNSFREFYRELCHALMALHETSLAYFSAIAGKIACSEKITKNNKALKNIAMTGEQIHQIIAKRITDAAEKKEIGLNAPVADVMMLFWLCLTGLVEKSSYREECLLRHLEKDRKAFLDFAFDALLFMIEKGNISDCEKAD